MHRVPGCAKLLVLVAFACLQGGCTCGAANEGETGSPHEQDVLPASPPPMEPARSVDQIRAQGNHLVGQPSPYLEQHAHNPVDWYPWGEEALAKAKAENKPIFLSIGYSTCHWCHVMERESFEDDEIAAFLNEHFVSIKVDREQRPDVDALYMDVVANMGASTGWPLNVFLTPDLEPIFGGTYFPPRAERGRPGFREVLERVHRSWSEDGDAIAHRGRELLETIERRALAPADDTDTVTIARLQSAIANLARHHDPVHGGYGTQAKFPNAPALLAELRWFGRSRDPVVAEHLSRTIEAMLRGGIRDHLDGTFHRYTVDARWHLPHFEKTLYDNAQLASLLIEAGRLLGRPEWISAGRSVLDTLIDDWQRDDGGFIVGFDADDPRGEGAYYSWTPDELQDALDPEARHMIETLYQVDARGSTELEGRSVLHRLSPEDLPETLRVDPESVRAALARMKAVRDRRPAPAADDKELVSWNALAVMALADAGRWLEHPRYVEAAQRAANFIWSTRRPDGSLARGRREGVSLGPGFLDDHALAVLAMIRLHAATGDASWLLRGHELARTTLERFHRTDSGTFMQAAADPLLPVRLADIDDGAMPSGGSAAILAMLELGALTGDRALYDIGYRALAQAGGKIERQPSRSGALIVALDHALAPVREVVIAGSPGDAATMALWAEVSPTGHARVLPVRLGSQGAPPELAQAFPALAGKRALKNRPTAFVCERGRCEAPTGDPARLREQLAAVSPLTRVE